jgi:hypothetical protein
MVDLPEPDSPVNQMHSGCLVLDRGARGLVHLQRLPVDIAGAAQREIEHAGADGLEAERSIRMKPPSVRLTA